MKLSTNLSASNFKLPRPKFGGPELRPPRPKSRGSQLSFSRPRLGGPEIKLPRPKLRAPRVAFARPTLGGPELKLPKLSLPKRRASAVPGERSRRTLGGPEIKLPRPKLRAPKLNLSRPTLGGPQLKLRRPKLGGPKLSLPKRGGSGPKLGKPSFKLPSRDTKLALPRLKGVSFGRRAGADVVGLDIQPGFVAAVKAHVNGSIVAERAAIVPLAPDTVRDGEVLDEEALTSALRELFAEHKLPKRVRVGVANQRTVLRTLELPPLTDQKELAAAVAFQAQDQVPMPLGNAVLDFQALGIIDTPAGPRQRVVLVAAQRDMVERLLSAVRGAGLTAEGVDLSAFALIRSLHRHDADQAGRVLYLNVDGLSNLAIAEGTVCRFTRVVGSGLEGMAVELAERRGIALSDARARLLEGDLSAPPLPEPVLAEPAPEPEPVEGVAAAAEIPEPAPVDLIAEAQSMRSPEEHKAQELEMTFEELSAAGAAAHAAEAEELPPAASDSDVFAVLDNGVREISGEVRNSIDFHRSQEGGGEVSHVVLSGAAQDIPGFAEALQSSLGVEVRSADLEVVAAGMGSGVKPHRLAVAAGLATTEAPR